jgi:formylglycine-generating enzyme required for sulfatase activity
MYKFTVEKTPTIGTSDVSESTNAPAKPKAVQNKYGIEMVYIPPGEFMMGSENGEKDQRPVHPVTISQAFYISRHEVTQVQWQSVMGTNPSYFKGDTRPVDSVTWHEAQDFIRKLNELNDGFRYRLPTEAEWEYACRAGTTGDYPGDLDAMAWYTGRKTQPVGQKQPNAFGLYDMQGNVWEWCQDWYHDSYVGAPMNGSAWEDGGKRITRIMRGGGSTNGSRKSSSSVYRGTLGPDDHAFQGIRLVATLAAQ